MALRTIDEHLRGLVDQFPVSDSSIRSVLTLAGVSSGLPIVDMSEEQIALCTAHLYVWCMSMVPYSRNNTSDSDGGWSHTEGGYQLLGADRKRWLGYLRSLLRRWGWPWLRDQLEELQDSKIRVYNL